MVEVPERHAVDGRHDECPGAHQRRHLLGERRQILRLAAQKDDVLVTEARLRVGRDGRCNAAARIVQPGAVGAQVLQRGTARQHAHPMAAVAQPRGQRGADGTGSGHRDAQRGARRHGAGALAPSW
ncbi:2-dehydropantoate 2-reductase domain protein [Acinetobacter baumannii 1419130]|nr:2-dehydropantoate 2-reductase domain protein [Acinetobacter baumannii 1419130]